MSNYDPIKLKSITAMRDDILVSVDSVEEKRSEGGIFIPTKAIDKESNRPQWCKIYAVGPEQTDVKAGQWAVIANMNGNTGVKIENDEGNVMTIRKVHINDVILVSDTADTSTYGLSRLSEFNIIRDDVIVTDMVFTERFSNSGLYIPSDDMKSTGVRPRWAKVYAVGPEQTDVKVGEWIMVSHGRWTRGFNIEDVNGEQMTIRKIDTNDILLVTDEEPNDETFSTMV